MEWSETKDKCLALLRLSISIVGHAARVGSDHSSGSPTLCSPSPPLNNPSGEARPPMIVLGERGSRFRRQEEDLLPAAEHRKSLHCPAQVSTLLEVKH